MNAAYIRTATLDEESIQGQIDAATAYFESSNFTIYIDYGFSAMDRNRPELVKLMNDVKLGKIKVVYTADIARFARNINHFYVLEGEIKNAGANLILGNMSEHAQKLLCDMITAVTLYEKI